MFRKITTRPNVRFKWWLSRNRAFVNPDGWGRLGSFGGETGGIRDTHLGALDSGRRWPDGGGVGRNGPLYFLKDPPILGNRVELLYRLVPETA